MCHSFTCLCGRDKTVVWEFGNESHNRLLSTTDWVDNTLDPHKIEFCRVEITPTNGSFLFPDGWEFQIVQDVIDRRDTLIEGAKSLGITRQGDYVMVKLDTGYRVEYLGG
jgi:hypothetical protein